MLYGFGEFKGIQGGTKFFNDDGNQVHGLHKYIEIIRGEQ